MTKRKPKQLEAEQVFGGASDLAFREKAPDVNLNDALFEAMDQAKTIDSFEEAMGISKKKVVQPKAYHKSIILDLDKEKDRKMLETLMNDTKYKVLSFEKNWSNLGRLRAFIIYSETEVTDNKE